MEIIFTKAGTVIVPKKYREKVGIREGEFIQIYSKGERFVLRKYEENSTYNTMVVGKGGRVRVPAEIKNELNLKANGRFQLKVTIENEIEYIILK